MHELKLLLLTFVLTIIGMNAYTEDLDDYEILGVAPTVNEFGLKSAFRRVAMVEHPDRGGDEERFKRIVLAYERLKKRIRNLNNIDVDSPFFDEEDADWTSYKIGLAARRDQSEKLIKIVRATLDNRIARVAMLTPIQQVIRTFFEGQKAFYPEKLLNPSLVEQMQAVPAEEETIRFVSLPHEAHEIYLARFREMVARLIFLGSDKNRELFIQSFFQTKLSRGLANFIEELAVQEPKLTTASVNSQHVTRALIDGISTTLDSQGLSDFVIEMNEILVSKKEAGLFTYVLANREEFIELFGRVIAMNSEKTTEIKDLEFFKMLTATSWPPLAEVECEKSLRGVKREYARAPRDIAWRSTFSALWARMNKKR